ncbi:AraC family transcriptional regulator [Paenibacillus alginolyticus]|uniref:AraC family transcriptional regulator n=1 Tax=Paenibacillus alginolyticus TaxID=59839 RepID=A0ABT4GC00_9BACL|nr:AraC family transcriptional regulator [Paenibacillus alginolyticus]MCY9667453.1 AraC family transcriptional regulator [Paenibacillus alginolyticus]MCY9693725.1 AraC family transcriptional regulator [Paenibacillus alginolyticus]
MLLYEIERLRRDQPFSMTMNHFHDHYEIYYLLRGKRYYFIQDRSYLIQEGDLVFIDKNELHKTRNADIHLHERILLNFDDSWIRSIDEKASTHLLVPFQQKQHIFSLTGANRTFVENLLFSLLREKHQALGGWQLNSKALLTQLLFFCSRITDKISSAQEDPPAYNPKIFEIVAYINEQYRNRLTLASISESFHISPSYFCRTFKETTGFSFIEYLNNVRIREAQRLLRETKLKVIHIAEQSGFDSVAHFGRVFKQVTTQTPLECRKFIRHNV